MIQDLLTRMDYQLTLTTSGQSTYYIDTLAAGDAMPAGSLAMWKVLCYTTPTATVNSTLTITLQTSPNVLFDSNAITLAATAALAGNLIQAQTANIAPPDTIAWPYNPLSTVLGPILVWMAIPVGCLRYLRTGYVIAGNFTTIGLTSEIIMDGDKLLSDALPLGYDIK